MSDRPAPPEVVKEFKRKEQERLAYLAKSNTFEGFQAYFQLVFGKPMEPNRRPMWEEYYKRVGHPLSGQKKSGGGGR
jgi:hypothetical protein